MLLARLNDGDAERHYREATASYGEVATLELSEMLSEKKKWGFLADLPNTAWMAGSPENPVIMAVQWSRIGQEEQIGESLAVSRYTRGSHSRETLELRKNGTFRVSYSNSEEGERYAVSETRAEARLLPGGALEITDKNWTTRITMNGADAMELTSTNLRPGRSNAPTARAK